MFYLMKKLLDTKWKELKNHKLGTYEINKISLPCFDDKRCVLGDRIRALAYFHKDSVTSCTGIAKDCNKDDYDCDKKDRNT